MKKAVLIAGVPGTGKSTVMDKIIDSLGGISEFTYESPHKLVIGHKSKEKNNFWILGDYRDKNEVFRGLDKASMAIQPMWREWVERESPNMILEGDRLVSINNINFLRQQGYSVKVYIITAPDEILQERYKKRGSNQPEQFLRAKQTKVNNIEEGLTDPFGMDDSLDGILEKLQHLTPDDTERIVDKILEFI